MSKDFRGARSYTEPSKFHASIYSLTVAKYERAKMFYKRYDLHH